ncbi:4Fe-4S dicluster domain-containing protein [Sulfurimonas autotrophica]|uniref:4Fe-4S ferredoxin iron-sulfur binding domain protein n=1 Tax=Sulfurimonas autotrophica (strain ATCC BAA-671 / DSM 16294 / JCM 11897 / OK10) TaxID=563040 RepID=E0UP87_SULAO|nr:ferredoxin family protein [Sulfurimonas autotrophica]ADN08551.1 4Fe-4S ferredoxin iron-sulfur binding domain protein [Sulfurimonas autotrophica DSM 16294]
MAKDFSKTQWHGIEREEIPWFPTVDKVKCIGCELCFVTCGRDVYDMVLPDGKHRKAEVLHPYNCMVGCTTCASVCPTHAISFPSQEIVWQAEKEHKIFSVVHKEAKEKREKLQALQERNQQQSKPEKVTKQRVMIAGEFAEENFLKNLQEFIQDKAVDIVNLKLEVPTLKGLLENTPAHMEFEVTSTKQEDIADFLNELRGLVNKSGLVWVK